MDFYTKEGRLTSYALGCGYIERVKLDGICTTLWAEANVYHVRQHDFGTDRGRVFWDVFDGNQLRQARKRFDLATRQEA